MALRYTATVASRKPKKEAAHRAAQRTAVLRQLGAQVKRLRLDRRLSQQALADRAQINYKHLGRIERAQAEAGAEMLVLIARALNVPVGELFERITPSDSVPYKLSPVDLEEAATALTTLTTIVERVGTRTPRQLPSRAPRRKRH